MILEQNVPLQPYNTFGIAARAEALVRVRSEADLLAVLQDARLAHLPRTVLGGGSNVVLTGDVKGLVLKVEVPGMRLAAEVPLKSKRVPISLAEVSTALRTSTILGSQTVSKEGMF